MTTEVSVHYHNGTNWVDLTNLCTAFEVEDRGITAIPTAVANFEAPRTDLNTFLANPYRLMRIQVNPSSWYPIFFGYVGNCHSKTLAGTIAERTKVSLDCFSYAMRLATEYITYDYYKAQSAISPHAGANAYSYRDMIESFLLYPDSTRDGTGLLGTGFELSAAVNANGIDHIINASCNWEKQTLLEAIRTSCEQIGYDGYFPCFSSATFTPTINIAPFDKANAATIDDPMIGEPEYVSGDINDVANVIFGWGGVDSGVPADSDRFTEYGVSKYDPVIWTGWSGYGNTTLSDADNTDFIVDEGLDTEANYGANAKCVKATCDDGTNGWMTLCLDLTDTEFGGIDAKKRCTSINLALYAHSEATLSKIQVKLQLADINDQIIEYLCSRSTFSEEEYLFPENTPNVFTVPIGEDINTDELEILGTGFWYHTTHPRRGNVWRYYNHTTDFDWEHVKKLFISVAHLSLTGSTPNWYVEVDGLQFQGGLKIEPYQPYSEALCPPLKDDASIAAHGIHPMHFQDSSISSFEQMQAEKARILSNLKNPIPTLSFTKASPETTQLYPSYVINSAYRISSIDYKWFSKHQRCDTTYKCVGKTSPLPALWTQDNTLRMLMR